MKTIQRSTPTFSINARIYSSATRLGPIATSEVKGHR